jgi:hypothetical protein
MIWTALFFAVELSLCLLLLWRGRWRRLKGLGLYALGLLLVDGVGRPVVLNHFGSSSIQYAYFYWLTDAGLALGAFLLIFGFFRRAFVRKDKIWRFFRMGLVFSFVLVLALSVHLLTRNHAQLYSAFIIEFSQNLYPACLVLNTTLFLIILKSATADDQLILLVCGMEIQFAGEAAAWALFHSTSGESFVRLILYFCGPVCTLGMLLMWCLTVAKYGESNR